MHPNYYLSPLVIAIAFGLASPAQAAEPMVLQKASLADLQQKFQMALPGHAKSMSVATDGLQFIKEHTDNNKITHVRMQQTYAGFTVVGGYAVLHSRNSVKALAVTQSNVRMNGVVYKGLQAELGQPESSYVKNADKVLAEFKAKFVSANISEEQVTPVVYMDEKHNAHWAYKVSILVQNTDKIPQRPTAILDAKTHKPFVEWNNIKTEAMPVQGIGFGGNSKSGVLKYGEGFPMLELRRDPRFEFCYMENNDVKVIDMMHKFNALRLAMKFPCPTPIQEGSNIYMTGYQADGYDKINGAASPSNDALYAGYVIKHLYHDWYNVEALANQDGSPMQLVMRVHYGEGYENAYWDGRQMTFGDGDTVMYPLVSLGVGAHEISHGFTEQHSDLEYYGQSGGMNEAFSDMAAQAAEFYSTGKTSWQIGAEIMKEGSGYDALRFMDMPSKDGDSIDAADEYYSGLDVHYSSGVYNRLFYLMSTQPDWNVRKAFDVMVKANMDYWTPYVDFEEGGCGILNAASDLGYSLDAVQKSLSEVAIDTTTCVIPK